MRRRHRSAFVSEQFSSPFSSVGECQAERSSLVGEQIDGVTVPGCQTTFPTRGTTPHQMDTESLELTVGNVKNSLTWLARIIAVRGHATHRSVSGRTVSGDRRCGAPSKGRTDAVHKGVGVPAGLVFRLRWGWPTQVGQRSMGSAPPAAPLAATGRARKAPSRPEMAMRPSPEQMFRG